MKDLILKYKKIFTLFSLVILTYFSVSLYITLKYNFEEVVRVIVTDTLGYNIDFDSVSLSFSQIKVEGVKLKDASDNLVVKAPSLYVKYNIRDALRGYFISDIHVVNPEVHLLIYDLYHTNITDALGIDLDSEESSTYSPLKGVSVTNGTLYYTDISYTNKIEKKVISLDGGLTLLKAKVDLAFEGRGAENYNEKLKFTLKTKGQTEFSIEGKNIGITDELLQYAFDDEGMIEYKGGSADLKLRISGSEVFGSVNVRDGSLAYEEIKSDVNNINLEGYFYKDRINLSAYGKVEDNNIEFSLDKERNSLSLNFKSKNLNSIDVIENIKSLDLSGVEGIIEYAEATLTFPDLINDPLNMQMKTYVRSNKLSYKNSSIANLRGGLNYNSKEDNFTLDNIRLDLSFMEVEELPIQSSLVLNGAFNQKRIDLDYSVSNKKSFFKQKELKGSFSYNFDYELLTITNNSEKLALDLLWSIGTGDVELVGRIDDEIRVDNSLELQSKVKGDLDIDFNYKTGKLRRAYGKMELLDGSYFEKIKLDISKDNNSLVLESLELYEGESELSLSGKIDFSDMKYEGKIKNFYFKSEDFELSNEYPSFDLRGDISFGGKGKEVEVDYDITMPNFDYFLSLDNTRVKGRVSYLNSQLSGTMEGYAGEFDYTPINFKDIYINLKLEDKKLYVKHIKNRHVYISGDYDIVNNELDLEYLLEDFSFERLNLDSDIFKGKLGILYGDIEGNIEKPYLTVNMSDSQVSINNSEDALIEGNLNFIGYKLYLNEFRFKRNIISGVVDFNEERLDLKVNVLESDLNQFYGDNNIKYRAIGQLNLWGEFENIRAVSSVNIDNIYYRGEELPDFFAKFSYAGGSLYNIGESGKVSLTSLSILADDDSKIVEAQGYLDISTREFKFTMDNERVVINNIQYLLDDMNLRGDILLNFNVEGVLDGDIDYDFNIESQGLSYNEIEIDSIKGRISGDKSKVHIDYINMEYDNNRLISQGEFDLETLKYNFTMQGDKMDLEVMNLFLLGKVDNIKGIADVNVLISNEKTEGTLKITDGGFNLLNSDLNLEGINTQVTFSQQGLRIDTFTGTINGGDLEVSGYYNIPELSEEVLVDRSLLFKDYNFVIDVDRMTYIYEKVIILTASADLLLRNNSLTGDVLINKGDVLKIPESKEKIQVPTREEVEKDSSFFDSFYAKLNINTEEGVLFSADNIPLVDDIELNIEGGGILEVREGKIYFTGRLITEKGVLTFNDNFFEVSSGIIVFDDATEAFPDINPSIALNSKTEISNEDIYINISGYYDSLELKLSSSSGLSEEDITSLLVFKKTLDESSVNEVVKDILDRQLSDQIFSPISKEIEKMLNVSKVRISSNVITTEDDEIKVTNDLILGAKIEIQNPLYEDIIYWNLKTEFSEKESGQVDSYDLWLDYKINKALSWQLGIERLDRNIENTDLNNLHIGLDFRFNRESIFDLWDKY